jgi:hypothetical protein
MPRDALEPGPPNWPNVPRKPDGSVDWERLGGEHPTRVRSRTTGKRYVIDPKPSVPDPQTGAPRRPE